MKYNIVMLLLSCFVLFFSQRAFTNLNKERECTAIVIKTDNLLFDMLNLETGQRGFIITGNPEYLDPYYAALPNFETHIKDLDDIAGSEYDSDIKQIHKLSLLKTQELESTINLRKSQGLEPAVRHIDENGNGFKWMNDIRTITTKIIKTNYEENRINAYKMNENLQIVRGIVAIMLSIYLFRNSYLIYRRFNPKKLVLPEVDIGHHI